MAQKIKVLAAGVVVLLALGSLGVANASAVLFHSEIKETFGFGEQEGETTYTTTAGTIKCKVVNGEGKMTATGGSGTNWTASSIKATPSVSGCTAFGQAVTRTENGCEYQAESSGKVSVECPPEKEILWNVTGGNCSITTGSQSGEAAFSNTTFAGKSSVKVVSKATGLKYTVHGGVGSICGEPGTHEDGKVTGSAVVRGYKSTTHTEANQVGIKVE